MESLKGLILSGGRGTRLRPITYTSAKQLVPVANKPVLFFGIEAMVAAGIEEIGIIIAPETGEEIRQVTGDGSRFGVKITYILQDEPAGLAHAVLTAEPFLGSSPFVMYLGDNLLQGGMTELVQAFRSNEPDALILLTPVPDPQNFGVAELHDGRVTRLVEKPPEPQTDLALCGVYMFTAGIHDAARAIAPSGRGELEITDAIQHLVDGGMRVEPHIVKGWWKDTGRLDDMLEANRLVLDTIDTRVEGELIESTTHGRVIIEPGARLERATVRGPAIIGAGARLTDCYIGPYTAVGDGCVVEKAEVEHSILLEGSQVTGLDGRMESSLLGRNVVIGRSVGQPRAFRFMVGDNSEIGILLSVRLVVTGADGMLGHRVVAEAAARGHDVTGTDLPQLDLTDPDATEAALAGERVIHCAAYTKVDDAETHEDLANLVNGDAAANVARVAAHVVALSTDYVFDGEATEPYTETVEPAPRTAYGRSKLLGERAVLGASPGHAVVRTAWLYGAGGPNFVDTMLRLGRERDEVRVVVDQVGSPTWTGHLAPVLVDLAERGAAGIFHAAGEGQCSWHDLACEAYRVAGLTTSVRETTAAEFIRPAPRPSYSVLTTGREDGVRLPPWQDGLRGHLA